MVFLKDKSRCQLCLYLSFCLSSTNLNELLILAESNLFCFRFKFNYLSSLSLLLPFRFKHKQKQGFTIFENWKHSFVLVNFDFILSYQSIRCIINIVNNIVNLCSDISKTVKTYFYLKWVYQCIYSMLGKNNSIMHTKKAKISKWVNILIVSYNITYIIMF